MRPVRPTAPSHGQSLHHPPRGAPKVAGTRVHEPIRTCARLARDVRGTRRTVTSREPPSRKPDADRTRRNILDVARAEFVEHGLSGARVDAIAERTATTKRMIYYYFGSKEGLYSAVLQQAYQGIRSAEADLALDDLPPETAMRRLIELTFDYHDAHQDFVRLVSIENIHQAAYLHRLGSIGAVNAGIIRTLSEIITRGGAAGAFRRSPDPVDLHMIISAPCFYRVSNQHTFGAIFGRDLQAPNMRQAHRAMLADMVLSWLRTPVCSADVPASPGPA